MEVQMKLLLTALLIASFSVLAHDDDDLVFYQASELVPWCRSEAESRYIGLGITPYQWASSYHDRSNVLYVNGRLRVHGEDVTVRCRVARGAREKYAVIEIDDPTLEPTPAVVVPDNSVKPDPVQAATTSNSPR
jgi:hypothetical protein